MDDFYDDESWDDYWDDRVFDDSERERAEEILLGTQLAEVIDLSEYRRNRNARGQTRA